MQQNANIRWIRVVFFGVDIQHELSCVGNLMITTCLLLSNHRFSCCQIWHHLLLFLRCELFPILVHRIAPQAVFCCLLLFLRVKEANPWHIPQSEQKHPRVWSGNIFGDLPLYTSTSLHSLGTTRGNVMMSAMQGQRDRKSHGWDNFCKWGYQDSISGWQFIWSRLWRTGSNLKLWEKWRVSQGVVVGA